MSTITIDFPDIRESDSAAYAYLANVYDSTCAHNQAAWRSPDETRMDGVAYAAWYLMDEYYTRGESAMLKEAHRLLTKHDRVGLHSEHNSEFCTGFYTVVDSLISL